MKFEKMCDEAQDTVKQMVELCLEKGYRMGDDEGFDADGVAYHWHKQVRMFVDHDIPGEPDPWNKKLAWMMGILFVVAFAASIFFAGLLGMNLGFIWGLLGFVFPLAGWLYIWDKINDRFKPKEGEED